MRILPSDEQHVRKEKILQAVIHLYIHTGKPVGSSAIGGSFRMNLSPASIRNVLAELERDGFLTHPHTSAGRVPTDLGYRYYVDSIVKIQKLAEEEEGRIRHEYTRKMQEIEDLMRSTTRILSTMSHCAGFVVKPRLEEERLSRIELISINVNQILAVLVSENGMVRNQMISVDRIPDENTLRVASGFLTDQLRGVSFSQAEHQLVTEMEKLNVRQLAQQDFLRRISEHLFEPVEETSLFVEGASNMVNFPEFQDLESLRNFTQLVDRREALAQVLSREFDQKGLQVMIGNERIPELRDFSVVSSCYQAHGRPLGVLGILGPKRMEYERMIAIVRTVADLVNRALEQNDRRFLGE